MSNLIKKHPHSFRSGDLEPYSARLIRLIMKSIYTFKVDMCGKSEIPIYLYINKVSNPTPFVGVKKNRTALTGGAENLDSMNKNLVNILRNLFNYMTFLP
mgnify:CR=1 FL=1